jgi:CheY-like chemotaxis protein/anti-sigma regulatory factor (Ser/Thr protein kinase)
MQVVVNLLQNAVKFTDAGGSLSVRVAPEPGGDRVALTVRDTGIGIPPELLPQIFEKYAQADRERSRGGLGLGLALVKGLVELHDGEVRVQSEGTGRGATFTVLLPVTEGPALPEKVSTPVPDLGVRGRVLIIEDSALTVTALRRLLQGWGHEVATARTGADGIARAREFAPDVVLCDLGLPDMKGHDVATELRNHTDSCTTRLIAVSGYAGEEDRHRAIEAGFDMLLAKPVPPEALRELLASLLTGK